MLEIHEGVSIKGGCLATGALDAGPPLDFPVNEMTSTTFHLMAGSPVQTLITPESLSFKYHGKRKLNEEFHPKIRLSRKKNLKSAFPTNPKMG